MVSQHVFDTTDPLAECSTRVVMWITAVTILVEIAAGWCFNSIALLADGWHMRTRAVAIVMAMLGLLVNLVCALILGKAYQPMITTMDTCTVTTTTTPASTTMS